MNENIDDIIQWEKPEASFTSPESIMGEQRYKNPPKHFILRGVCYEYCNISQESIGGCRDGEKWHMARRTDEGDSAMPIWVCESKPGEFIQAFIPREMKDEPFVQ